MLKIDREFVARLARGRRQQRLVEGIIGLTRGLDLTSVAEGVESEEQRAWLHSAGCDLYRGYLLARPCPAPDVTPKLEDGRLAVAGPEEPAVDATGR